MSFETDFAWLKAAHMDVTSVKTFIEGRIPFVDVDAPLAMMEIGPMEGWTAQNRRMGVSSLWRGYVIRYAVPSNDVTDMDDIAATERALGTVVDEVLAAFQSNGNVRIPSIDGNNPRESWIEKNGVVFRIAIAQFEVRDLQVYGVTP